MSKISNLRELYIDELKDLWSANDQMTRALRKIAPKATHQKLRVLLESSPAGIDKHTALVKKLIEAQDENVTKAHCKGMEGLAAEAIKHTIDEAPTNGAVLDASIIAQYQRMTHYGITGFGTVAAFARALHLDDDSEQLEAAVEDMHLTDDLMTEIAEAAVNVKAVNG